MEQRGARTKLTLYWPAYIKQLTFSSVFSIISVVVCYVCYFSFVLSSQLMLTIVSRRVLRVYSGLL